jgi:CAAX prenyl protease-like protein
MLNKIAQSPLLVRISPFVIFAALTIFQSSFGEAGQYWIYTLKTVLAVWMLWLVRPHISEMRWKLSWEAVVVGIGVFVAWVGLDGFYPMLSEPAGNFNPLKTYGEGSGLAIFFIVVRTIGSSLVVPPLEEAFYRSFLYRYLIKADFINIPLSTLNWRAFLLAGIIFGIGHYEWLPGILCAFAYQWLVLRKDRLGEAMTAHAITNFLLALWVVGRHAYSFW